MSTSRPVSLSDQQLSAVMSAAEPLAPADRDAFLRALANVLRGEEQPLGDGAVFRAVRALQREFWTPPTSTAGPQSTRRHVGPELE